MKSIYGLYPGPDSAQRAVNSLRAAGVTAGEITVISAEPFEEYDFSHHHKATWLYWIAGFGGFVGLCFGSWLTSMTQGAWPLPTGGMPIVALWTNLVVIFELTMLSAILATVLTLLITTRLPRRRPKLYDPEVADGYILVGVEDTSSSSGDLQRALKIDDAARVRTID